MKIIISEILGETNNFITLKGLISKVEHKIDNVEDRRMLSNEAQL